jgi:hypothetical protein
MITFLMYYDSFTHTNKMPVDIHGKIWHLKYLIQTVAGPSGLSPAEIVRSNPTGGMDVCLSVVSVVCFQVQVSASG